MVRFWNCFCGSCTFGKTFNYWAFDLYLTIIPRVRVAYEMVDSQRGAWHQVGYNHLISNKRERNNCFIKNAHKKKLPVFSLFLILSRRVQLPYLENMVLLLIYYDDYANQSSRIALFNDSVFNNNNILGSCLFRRKGLLLLCCNNCATDSLSVTNKRG